MATVIVPKPVSVDPDSENNYGMGTTAASVNASTSADNISMQGTTTPAQTPTMYPLPGSTTTSPGSTSSGSSNTSGSPITSSALNTMDPNIAKIIQNIITSGSDNQTMLSAMMSQVQGLSQEQAQSIINTGSATQQSLAAQGTSGDAAFQAQIQQTRNAEAFSLGNADISASQSNPSGTQMLQPNTKENPISYSYDAQGNLVQSGTNAVFANSTYAGMKANIQNNFEATIGTLVQGQQDYDAQVKAGEATAAAQTEANLISAASASAQNQLNIMNSMMTTAQNSQNLTLQAETASLNFQSSMGYNQAVIDNNNKTLAIGQLNSALQPYANTLAEGGYNALPAATQQMLQTLSANAGYPPNFVQSQINTNNATSLVTTSSGLFGSTVQGVDGNGQAVGAPTYVKGSLDPSSPSGQAALLSGGGINWGGNNTPQYSGQIGIFSTQTLNSMFGGASSGASSLAVSAANSNGYTAIPLSTTDLTNMNNGNSALSETNQAMDNILADPALRQYASANPLSYLTAKVGSVLNESDISSINANNAAMVAAAGYAGMSGTGGGGIGVRTVISTLGDGLINPVTDNVQDMLSKFQQMATLVKGKMSGINTPYANQQFNQYSNFTNPVTTTMSGGSGGAGSAVGSTSTDTSLLPGWISTSAGGSAVTSGGSTNSNVASSTDYVWDATSTKQ